MSRLLMDDPPLVVQPALAVAVGLNEAIVLQQIHYWLQHNQKTKRHLIDDVTWCYNSIPEWVEQFPFWSERTIWHILKSLRKSELLRAEMLSPDKRDRTLYYTIDYEKVETVTMQAAEVASSIPQELRDASLQKLRDVYKEQRLATETTTENKNMSPQKSGGASAKLLEIYNLNRGKLPEVKILNAKRKRLLSKLVKEFGADDSSLLLGDATKNVALDPFWIERGYNLDNLLAGDKVVEKAEKHRAAKPVPQARAKVTAQDVLREGGFDDVADLFDN